jgi:hypothetical protein
MSLRAQPAPATHAPTRPGRSSSAACPWADGPTAASDRSFDDPDGFFKFNFKNHHVVQVGLSETPPSFLDGSYQVLVGSVDVFTSRKEER